MFERLSSGQEIYQYKLGAALKMEREVLDILDDSIEESRDEQVRAALQKHRAESERHVRNVEEVFGLFGWNVDDSPCPTIEGLHKEAKATVRKTDDALDDLVLLQGAVEVEHHEIGVYENLITTAKAMGRDDVIAVLTRNLVDEQETLEQAKRLQARVAASVPMQAA